MSSTSRSLGSSDSTANFGRRTPAAAAAAAAAGANTPTSGGRLPRDQGGNAASPSPAGGGGSSRDPTGTASTPATSATTSSGLTGGAASPGQSPKTGRRNVRGGPTASSRSSVISSAAKSSPSVGGAGTGAGLSRTATAASAAGGAFRRHPDSLKQPTLTPGAPPPPPPPMSALSATTGTGTGTGIENRNRATAITNGERRTSAGSVKAKIDGTGSRRPDRPRVAGANTASASSSVRSAPSQRIPPVVGAGPEASPRRAGKGRDVVLGGSHQDPPQSQSQSGSVAKRTKRSDPKSNRSIGPNKDSEAASARVVTNKLQELGLELRKDAAIRSQLLDLIGPFGVEGFVVLPLGRFSQSTQALWHAVLMEFLLEISDPKRRMFLDPSLLDIEKESVRQHLFTYPDQRNDPEKLIDQICAAGMTLAFAPLPQLAELELLLRIFDERGRLADLTLIGASLSRLASTTSADAATATMANSSATDTHRSVGRGGGVVLNRLTDRIIEEPLTLSLPAGSACSLVFGDLCCHRFTTGHATPLARPAIGTSPVAAGLQMLASELQDSAEENATAPPANAGVRAGSSPQRAAVMTFPDFPGDNDLPLKPEGPGVASPLGPSVASPASPGFASPAGPGSALPPGPGVAFSTGAGVASPTGPVFAGTAGLKKATFTDPKKATTTGPTKASSPGPSKAPTGANKASSTGPDKTTKSGTVKTASTAPKPEKAPPAPPAAKSSKVVPITLLTIAAICCGAGLVWMFIKKR